MVHLQSRQCAYKPGLGFTLGELLISLAILGVIAIFTIPKVLSTQRDQSYNAKAKEAASMVLQAYQITKLNGTLTPSSNFNVMTPYMNYLARDTTSTVDRFYGGGTVNCSVLAYTCLKLHNGSTIFFDWPSFGGTATTNAIWFAWDPDGTSDGTTNGPGKSVEFHLYYNGALKTRATIPAGTRSAWGLNPQIPTADPPWFSW